MSPLVRFPGRAAARPSPRQVTAIVGALVVAAVAAYVSWAVRPSPRLRSAGPPQRLGSFGWLANTFVPATWARFTVPSGLGTLSSPPGFRVIRGDPGTLSVGLLSSTGTYLGYLNVTGRQGPETLQNWPSFRLTHLRGDEAASVQEDAAVQSVPTSTTVRSCVTDDYLTTVGHHRYHEVACYVMNGSVGSVVIAATPTGDPAHVWTQLQRAVAAYPSQ